MKQYNIRLLLWIVSVALSSIVTGYFLSEQFYLISGISTLILLWTIYRLFIFQKRNTKDMKRLISAIRFSEFNISFENFTTRGLSPELIPDMETSVSHFNNKLMKMEMEQNFYEILLNRIDFGIIIVDKQERIKWINKSALDLFEKPQPRQLSDLSKISETLPQMLRDLLPQETKIIKIDEGKIVHQLAVSTIYFQAEEKRLKLISLKNIQSVLDESENEAWKKLIRVLTHEIMNSITPIISLAETFATPDEEVRKMLPQAMETIHRRSKGLVDFVHNYQKLSRIPNPTLSIFSATDLMTDISNLLKSDGLNFSYTIYNNDISFKADRAQMEQVMINLIKNACEAAANQPNPQVSVEIGYSEYHRPTIKVTDNGEGILPEVCDKVFIPFFTTKTNGSGIGLSICRQIVNLHGGTISVQSEVGKGSCFRVVL
ncbi:MAG: GHKL domain-containing protein [Dysgonamonadaceae bacterium]|jgi:nitrogen fixation/metabolism regulation signal transduction histidine kinase|nr:GHKL domain-containing protein [Dysgonamonadaceae bacterium]